jgi:hypothetical protein
LPIISERGGFVSQNGKKEILEVENVDWSYEVAPAVYSDYIHAALNKRQLVLSFGQRDVLKDPQTNVKYLTSIAMHPDTARELHALLSTQLDLYDGKLGKEKGGE